MKNVVLLLTILLLNVNLVFSGDAYWLGSTNSFNTASNWVQSDGVTPFGSVPGSGDNVYFDDQISLNDCSFDSSPTVLSFNIGNTGMINDYSGLINLNSSTLTVIGDFILTSTGTGEFDAGTGTIIIGGNFTNDATFTYGTTSTVRLERADGTTTVMGGGNTTNFYNLEFRNTRSGGLATYTVKTSTVNGTLTINTGSDATNAITLNTGTLTTKGDVTVSGSSTNTSTGGGTATIKIGHASGTKTFTGLASEGGRLPKVTIQCNAAATINLVNTICVANTFQYVTGIVGAGTSCVCISASANLDGYGTAAMAFNNLIIKSGITATLTGHIDVNGTLTVESSATLAASTFNVNVWTLTSSGSVTQTTGTITLDKASSSTHTLSSSGTNTIYNLTINASNTLTSTSGTLTIGAVLSNSGTFTHNSGTVSFAGTTSISGSVPDFNNVTITSGTFTAPAGTMNVAGTFTNSSNFTHSSGTLNLNGTSVFTPGTGPYYNINVNGTATVTLAGNLDVNGTLTTAAGATLAVSTYNVNVQTMTSAGAITQTAGTFTLDHATAGVHSIAGTNSFNNLTINASNSFTSTSGTLTILGVLTNSGSFAHGSGTVSFAGTTSISGTVPSFNNVTIASGTFTAPASTMNVAGNFTNSSNFTHSSGTLNFNGTTNFTPGTGPYYNITVAGTSVTLAGALDVNGTLNISSGTLSASTYTINYTGSWTNTGTFTANTGKVIFDGSSSQNINNTTTFYNVDVAAGSVIVVPNGVTMTVSNNMNLLATTASNTAMVDLDCSGDGSTCGTLTVSGTATMQSYLSASTSTGTPSSEQWHIISSPVNSMTAVPTLEGYFGKYYNEATGLYVSLDKNSTLTNGKGFMVRKGTAGTITYTGTFNSYTSGSPYTFSLTKGTGGGYHLLGNPFPCTIDLADAASGWTRSSINATVTYRNAGSYEDLNLGTGLGNGSATRYLAPGQAVWVLADAGGANWTMDNRVRVTNTSTVLKKGSSANQDALYPNALKLLFLANGRMSSTIIGLNQEATNNYDSYFDAIKQDLSYNYPHINSRSMESNDTIFPYSMNFLPMPLGETSVPVEISITPGGTYALEGTLLESFDTNISIYLEDLKTNSLVDLKLEPVYTFQTNAVVHDKRFIVHFMPETITAVEKNATSNVTTAATPPYTMFYSNNTLYIKNNESTTTNADLFMYDMAGKQIYNTKISTNGLSKTSFNDPTGIYFAKIVSSEGVYAQKVYVK